MELLNCPFCGGEGWIIHDRQPPPLWRGQCKQCGSGQGGYPNEPEAITAWNTRIPDTAPSQSAGLIAEAENWQKRYSTRDKGDVLIGALVDALRAAEAENARLREALTGEPDAGLVLMGMNAFDAVCGSGGPFDVATANAWKAMAAAATRRALGGGNDAE